MTTQTEALKRYLDDCDKHAIVPDIAGAFHFAWQEALAQPEQPKVRTGDCLLTGFCASEGHKIQKAQPEQDTCKGCSGNGVVGNILDTDTCPFCKGSGIEAQPEQHQDWCASLTQLLMSMPPKPAPCNCKPPQRTWVGLMRGVRVEGDTVVISTKNNDAARELCGALIEEMNR